YSSVISLNTGVSITASLLLSFFALGLISFPSFSSHTSCNSCSDPLLFCPARNAPKCLLSFVCTRPELVSICRRHFPARPLGVENHQALIRVQRGLSVRQSRGSRSRLWKPSPV